MTFQFDRYKKRTPEGHFVVVETQISVHLCEPGALVHGIDLKGKGVLARSWKRQVVLDFDVLKEEEQLFDQVGHALKMLTNPLSEEEGLDLGEALVILGTEIMEGRGEEAMRLIRLSHEGHTPPQ